MKLLRSPRTWTALTVSIVALTGPATAVSARGRARVTTAGAVTRTFAFIGRANSPAKTLFNVDSLLINARCNSQGSPVIFAFTSAVSADLFGRAFDGLGRVHIIKNSSFTKRSRGVLLSTTSGDFDSTGTVLYETSNGTVVTVNYAFDNSTTLSRQPVCTVYGSLIAT